jgi:hypothetical protein
MGPRTLDELINAQVPAWPLVQEWIAAARNPVEVLSGTRTQGERMLLALQVTTRSPMGAIALESGGILIDHGWLRILGAGSERMRGSLLTWNGQGDDRIQDPIEGALVIAMTL